MIDLLTTKQMAEADRLTIAAGTPGFDLMMNAGQAVALHVQDKYPGKRCLVLCGPGNNGGDGFVAARLLQDAGWEVAVHLLGAVDRLVGDAALAAAFWDGPVAPLTAASAEEGTTVIIDAIFGAGLARNLEGDLADLVGRLNARAVPVVAVDVPSGLDGDTGEIRGAAVIADSTVTFFRKKPGHLLYPGRELCGEVGLADIGIKNVVLQKIRPQSFENTAELWQSLYPWPQTDTHKYRRGMALVFAGGPYTGGAARLTARAALRAGAGLVHLCAPAEAMQINACHLDEVMLRQVDTAEEAEYTLSEPRITAAAFGPANGIGEGTRAKVLAALASHAPVVLDADALTSFEVDRAVLFKALRPSDVLTPHRGEFERLFPGLYDSSPSRLEAARAAAEKAGAVMVLKGADSVIAAPDGRAAINTNGTPWLATAGSGDVLTGIITGLVAQGMPGFEAACAGVWLHGAAAEFCGPGLIAGDLIEALPEVLTVLADETGISW